jgi:adenylosuccinate lyase
MAYKRNPMKAERMCSLARFVTSLQSSADQTFATQWLERTLDDSAVRRLNIPQGFLATDAVLILYQNIAKGIVVYPKSVERHLNEELPFMATEEILMAGVQAGGDRQVLHERIRVHSLEAAKQVKEHGQANDLLERLKGDPSFEGVDLSGALDGGRFVGRAPEQVDSFVANIVQPIRDRYAGMTSDLSGEVTV